MKDDSKPMRANPNFIKEIKDMQNKRIVATKKDPPLKPSSTSRLTLAMTRHPLFKKMKLDIVEADLT